MCLTLDALVAFMAFLPMEIIETDPDRITIHAERNKAVWVAEGNLWCVERPAIDVTWLEEHNLLTPRR